MRIARFAVALATVAAACAPGGAGTPAPAPSHDAAAVRPGDTPAAADHAAHGASPLASPYVGEEAREIKALSAGEITTLLEGQGMGFALAAELNGLPGPRHVLDAADQLGLTDDQRTRIQAIFDGMQAEAKRLGAGIVDGERALDRLFAAGSPDPADIARRTQELGRLTGELRGVHLLAHLATTPLLTAHQRMAYARLRGYQGTAGHEGHGGGANLDR